MSRRARQRALARPWAQGEAPEPIDDPEHELDWQDEQDQLQEQDHQHEHPCNA